MAEENEIFRIDSIDEYNRALGFETKHPLVAVVDMSKAKHLPEPKLHTTEYGVYALWLKQTKCGDITYGRMPYDYQEGTVTSFAPGQAITVKPAPDYKPRALGLIFSPELIHGTSLGKNINKYDFFSYSSREALHLSEDEKVLFKSCLNMIDQEISHPTDSHSKGIICRNIELLLDYCMRFYDRQFITRKAVNKGVLVKFEELLNDYFKSNKPILDGLPSVKYFAENCFLSPNYFGDMVKKETGLTPQEHIQNKIVSLAKEELASTEKTVNEIAMDLGFQYSQHFNRYFKRTTGITPSAYRKSLSVEA